MFAYANGPRNTTLMSADRSRQMRAALARNRGASAKGGHPEAASASDVKADIGDAQDALLYVSDSDDDRDDQRQSHRFHIVHDIEAESTGRPMPADAFLEANHPLERKRTSMVPPPERNGDAMIETSIRKLLDMRDALAATPSRNVRACVYALLIDMITSYRRSDSPHEDSISRLHDTFCRIVAERASSDTTDRNRPAPEPHERVQHFNALLGLLLLNTCRPSTPMQHERALARLRALRRAASARVPGVVPAPPPACSPDDRENGTHP